MPFTPSSMVTARSRGQTLEKQDERPVGSLWTKDGFVVNAVHGMRCQPSVSGISTDVEHGGWEDGGTYKLQCESVDGMQCWRIVL
eukprot:14345364-Ditylum_brightwellii.AAC.1